MKRPFAYSCVIRKHHATGAITMLSTQVNSPFAMLLDPERVVREMHRSERLARLHSRIYRPLDKPLIPEIGSQADASAAFDRMVDEAPEEAEQIVGTLLA
jgi:hypothetical protein